MPLSYIRTKTRPLIDSEDASYTADHTPDRTSDDGADRSGRSFAFTSAAINAARYTLCDGSRRRDSS
jgi:hypothetical protein